MATALSGPALPERSQIPCDRASVAVARNRAATSSFTPASSLASVASMASLACLTSLASLASRRRALRRRPLVCGSRQAGLTKKFRRSRTQSLKVVLIGFAVCVAAYKMFMLRSSSGFETFTERLHGYRGVCGSLAADLGFSAVAFVAFAVCAGTETAITTLWPWKVREYAQREMEKAEQKVREMREGGGKRVTAKVELGKWTALREDIQRFMQTILIGATVAGVVSTAFITEICGQLFGPRGLGIATVSVTLVQLTLGEILPKSMAVSNPYTFAQATLPAFYRISAVVYPASKMLNEAVSVLLKMVGLPVDTKKTPFVSEEELDLVFRSAMQSGVVDAEEGEMIRSVRNLDSKRIKEIMTPLVDMICIESEEPISKLHHLIKSTQFSRIPVYEMRFDNIIGVVSMKTLLKNANCLEEVVSSNARKVHEICDIPIFVPETMSLISALRLLKERTLAVCVDEYGGTTGLITLEDVLEEIVGEIYDPDEEKDQVERQQNRAKIQEKAPGHYSMTGLAEKDEVEEVLGIKMPEGDYNSIGGFMCMTIDRIPLVGEAATVETASDKIRFEVSKVDERRVMQVEAFLSGKGTVEQEEAQDDEEKEKSQVIYVELDLLDGQNESETGLEQPVLDVNIVVDGDAKATAEGAVLTHSVPDAFEPPQPPETSAGSAKLKQVFPNDPAAKADAKKAEQPAAKEEAKVTADAKKAEQPAAKEEAKVTADAKTAEQPAAKEEAGTADAKKAEQPAAKADAKKAEQPSAKEAAKGAPDAKKAEQPAAKEEAKVTADAKKAEQPAAKEEAKVTADAKTAKQPAAKEEAKGTADAKKAEQPAAKADAKKAEQPSAKEEAKGAPDAKKAEQPAAKVEAKVTADAKKAEQPAAKEEAKGTADAKKAEQPAAKADAKKAEQPSAKEEAKGAPDAKKAEQPAAKEEAQGAPDAKKAEQPAAKEEEKGGDAT